MSEKVEVYLGTFERKILGTIRGPIKENAQWTICYNSGVRDLYKDTDVVIHIKLRRLEWTETSAGWTDQGKNTKENLRRKVCGSLPVGKPNDSWIDAGTRDARKLLGTAALKILSVDRKIWGRGGIEEARARNWAAMP
jgi:hypothetical protein